MRHNVHRTERFDKVTVIKTFQKSLLSIYSAPRQNRKLWNPVKGFCNPGHLGILK